jgi:hypothetical protein
MANLNRRSQRILITLLLLLVVASLVGHFIADMSGRDPLPAFGLHAGFVLLSLVAAVSTLMFITALCDDDPIRRLQFLLPLIQPPITLH